MDRIFGCVSCLGYTGEVLDNDFPIQLTSNDTLDSRGLQPITRTDSFDITFGQTLFNPGNGPMMISPRVQGLRARLDLPVLHHYPSPPNCSSDEPEDSKMRKLMAMYQEFTVELHAGVHLSQLTSTNDYSDIHCQLMDDLQTLKLDQSNGHIIEFPLTGVSKIYRIIKSNDGGYYNAATLSNGSPTSMEHIVVVEFQRRKLAFVFQELQTSCRFLTCMELLIRRAQQKQQSAPARALTPAFPAPAKQTG